MADPAEHALVERAQQLELAHLIARVWLARADVGDRSRSRLEDRPLKRCRQEPGIEAIDAAGRNQAAIQDHKSGQILAHASQPVGDPGAVAGPALQAAAGVHEVIRARVLREVGDHRAHDGEIVDALSDPREQVADRDAALAVVAKLPGQASTLPTLLNCVGCVLTLIGCPCSRSSLGLGSNVSTCDGPPSMNRKITLLALAAKLRRPGGKRVRFDAVWLRLRFGGLIAHESHRRPDREGARPRPAHQSRFRTASSMSRREKPGPRNRWQCMESPGKNRRGRGSVPRRPLGFNR